MASPPADEDARLSGQRILIVEDEVFIAMELEEECQAAGASVVGPVHSLSALLKILNDAEQHMDGAILDIMLGDQEVFPAVQLLIDRKIPFLFHSGHALRHDIEERFPGVPLCRKPSEPEQILTALVAELAAAA